MTFPRNIILIGFMGSGKTSTGKQLAELLKFQFFDLDEKIEEKFGKKVSDIFEEEGEEFFRSAERVIIAELEPSSRAVICPGGGAWMDERSREILLECGWCIWLDVSPAEAWRRIRADPILRPLIKRSLDPANEIRSLLEKRNPIYALANQRVVTDERNPKEIAHSIMESLKKNFP
jgi:shikimate kinase